MKLLALIASTAIASTALASQIVIPKKAEVNLHYLDSGYSTSARCAANEIQVTGPRFIENGYNQDGIPASSSERNGSSPVSKLKNSFCYSTQKFLNEQNWSKSVYPTLSGGGLSASGGYGVGTSFLVGKNIVMTAEHIARPSKTNSADCQGMSIQTREPKPRMVSCKRVLFCNPVLDYCFIEMNSVAPNIELSDLSNPLLLNPRPIYDRSLVALGNSMNLGIQASQGRIVTDPNSIPERYRVPGIIMHYIPTVSGASGSPIVNSYGEVIALHHSHAYGSQRTELIDTAGDSFNMATSINGIFADIHRRGYTTLENLFGQ